MLGTCFVLALALVALLASSAIKQANVCVAEIAREFATHAKATREAMDSQDEYTAGVVAKFHERAWQMTSNKEVMEFVRSRGLMPFMQDRDSMLNAEIQTIQKNLGCDREEAILYIRSRFAQAVAESEAAR